MNLRQKRILIAAAVVIAGMMLYPPFYYPRDALSGVARHGYDWLLGSGLGRVEVDLLFAQFVAVGVIGRIAYLLCADEKK